MNVDGSFGEWLRQRRKALDLTQADLADQVGCSAITVYKIEHDLRRPSKQIAERLADALVISPEQRAAFAAFARRSGDVAASTPAQTTTATALHNLPLQPTPFVGREVELAQIAERLADPTCRLLTLIGPGGIGKTHLALRAAEEQITNFVHGVHFVALAPVASPGLLTSAIASALETSFYGPETPDIQLLNFLRNKEMLLVLDNFEHLMEATGLLVRLLADVPQLKIFVTSRERLNLTGEWVLPIQGLPFPGKDEAKTLETYAAVQLFVQRAQRVQPRFSLADDPASVKAICQLVEGMPLALELAATWLRSVSCREIARQIERNLDFLATPLRDVPERHQSLRAVFDHSWSLLVEDEQQVLAILSVFRGGFDLDAAEQVADASPSILAGLVDKSLIRLQPSGRYDLHERLRQYVLGKLAKDDEMTTARRHFEFFLNLATQSEPQIYGPAHEVWVDRLEMEHDNLRAALDWSTRQETGVGLRLAIALGLFWETEDYWVEGSEWFERLLALAHDAPDAMRAKALQLAGELAAFRGNLKHAQAQFENALALARGTEEVRTAAWALTSLGSHIESRKDLGRAKALLEEGVALFRGIGDPSSLGHALNRLGQLTAAQGDYERATTYTEEALVLGRETSDVNLIAWALFISGTVVWLKDSDSRRAESLFQVSLPLFKQMRSKFGLTESNFGLGVVRRAQGQYAQAEMHYRESLSWARKTGYFWRIATCLAGLGGLAQDCDRLEEAARLLGAAGAIRVAYRSPLLLTNPIQIDVEVTALSTQLDAAIFARAWADGQVMTLDQAVDYALKAPRDKA